MQREMILYSWIEHHLPSYRMRYSSMRNVPTEAGQKGPSSPSVEGPSVPLPPSSPFPIVIMQYASLTAWWKSVHWVPLSFASRRTQYRRAREERVCLVNDRSNHIKSIVGNEKIRSAIPMSTLKEETPSEERCDLTFLLITILGENLQETSGLLGF